MLGVLEPENAVSWGTGTLSRGCKSRGRWGHRGAPENQQPWWEQSWETRRWEENRWPATPGRGTSRTDTVRLHRRPTGHTYLPALWHEVPVPRSPAGAPSWVLEGRRENAWAATPTLIGGVNQQWLNLSPDLISDWGNLKWQNHVFSIGDWWLMSSLDSFLGNYFYFYPRGCVHTGLRTQRYTANAVGKWKEEDIVLSWRAD